MKRGHTADEYRERIHKLRQVRPNISLSSDFIVGFPGETEVEFKETMDLIDEIGFDTSFSFIYSARPGTPAAGLVDEIPETTKKAWLQTLQARIRDQADAISQAMVGSEQRVLVMSEAKKGVGQLAARTENNRVVNFAGRNSSIGSFAKVRISEALPNSLRGTLIDS